MTDDGQAAVGRARVETFFEALLRRDPSGSSWLSALLSAAPNGRERFGELAETPGYLEIPLAVPSATGPLACFEYRVAPPPELLAWFIEHPDQLVWPTDASLSRTTARLRAALLYDDPPGAQARARERARDLLAAGPSLSPAWWKFANQVRPDCVLITDRVVITIATDGAERSATDDAWYPGRSWLVRSLEAARTLSAGRSWGTVQLSEHSIPDAAGDLESSLPTAAPHLSEAGRAELRAAYLGNLTWASAGRAVGLPNGASE